MATTSERLKEIMALRNIKQVDIIEKTGITKGALSSYISGRYEPKQKTIYQLAKCLDVNEAWLMGLDVPMDRRPVAPVIHNDIQREELLKNYEMLNDEGREELLKYSRLLTASDLYKRLKDSKDLA